MKEKRLQEREGTDFMVPLGNASQNIRDARKVPRASRNKIVKLAMATR